MKHALAITSASLVLMFSGCSSITDSIPGYLKPYRPDVYQGNVVTEEMVSLLQNGMTRNQVVFLLGTPALKNPFHQNEWDYVYYVNPRIGKPQMRRLSLKFNEDGRVESFVSDKMPDETSVDLQILGERARKATIEKNSPDSKSAKP
jgi:outer membrane protein assembly factor BamE